MLDVQRSDLVGAVVGSGTMGRGIVQVLAQCGIRTLVFDAKPGAARAAKDSVGQALGKLAGRGYIPESLGVLVEGIADFATIDRILVDAAGFRLGPFGLMDLVGLDVNQSVHKSLFEQYFNEPKYRPSYLLEPRVAAGLL